MAKSKKDHNRSEIRLPRDPNSRPRPHRDPREYSRVLNEVYRPCSDTNAFVVLPEKTDSSVLLDDEIIILILRQHWITLVPTYLLVIFLIVVPFFFFTHEFFDSFTIIFRVMVWAFWYLGVAGIILQRTVTWFHNVYILTDERIVDVNFPSILTSDISTTKLDSVVDYSMKNSGFLSTMLDYGTIEIQTAGEEKEFSFFDVPHPGKIIKLLGELVAEEEREAMEGRVR